MRLCVISANREVWQVCLYINYILGWPQHSTVDCVRNVFFRIHRLQAFGKQKHPWVISTTGKKYTSLDMPSGKDEWTVLEPCLESSDTDITYRNLKGIWETYHGNPPVRSSSKGFCLEISRSYLQRIFIQRSMYSFWRQVELLSEDI